MPLWVLTVFIKEGGLETHGFLLPVNKKAHGVGYWGQEIGGVVDDIECGLPSGNTFEQVFASGAERKRDPYSETRWLVQGPVASLGLEHKGGVGCP